MHSTFKTTFSALLAAGLALAACQSDPGPGSPAISPTDVPDAPSGSGEGEDDRATTPDAGEPPGDCQLGSHWDRAPTTSCSASTGACIAKATTGAAASACITADENCSTCFSDSVQGCLVGTPGKPGPCASQAGCVDGCVVGVCGKKPTESCRVQASTTGACKTLSDDLQRCFTKADQRPCMDRFRAECLPKASCGNQVVDPGETCDGNCSSSCPAPPPGDLCANPTLKGNAATCSAFCEAQSTCPVGCPSNAAAISSVGVIASGAALPTASKVNWPTLSALKAHGCPSTLAAPSHVIAWRAPAAGRYTFSGTCNVTWEEYEIGTGRPFTHALQCIRRVALANGKQCAAGVSPFACSLDVNHTFQQSQLPDVAALAPIPLDAGDEVLVAVDFGVASVPPVATANTYGGHVTSSSWSVTAASCVPQCAGKSCGADGCGGTCGACAAGQPCTAGGQCQAACVPQCAGRSCGADGCGGSCGGCAAGQACTAGGQCQAACVPQCAGRSCGSNGCGGSCGGCAAGQACTAGGQCQAACVPQCAGRNCGSNGCGGSCGTCAPAQFCNAASRCELSGPCDPVNAVGCAAPNQCITLANESNQCVLMGAGTQGSPCANSASCKGGFGCFAGTCRKVCDKATGNGCDFGDTCSPVAGWVKFGTCAP